ncbi:hypothetical protein HOY80DRAFT_940323 [Tuber brumale]|nr:hypothetical protein HOY80DRAFT_940323 [Tuber brumale]
MRLSVILYIIHREVVLCLFAGLIHHPISISHHCHIRVIAADNRGNRTLLPFFFITNHSFTPTSIRSIACAI